MNGRAITGLVICAIGVVLSFVVKTGYIWYGAIAWGAILFIRGLVQGSGE